MPQLSEGAVKRYMQWTHQSPLISVHFSSQQQELRITCVPFKKPRSLLKQMGMTPSITKVWDVSMMSLVRDRGLPRVRNKRNSSFQDGCES